MLVVVVESGQEFGQVCGGDLALEGTGSLVVARREGGQAVGYVVEVGEVVGREQFPLNDRQSDEDAAIAARRGVVERVACARAVVVAG
jgi:hypothetical protein